MSDTSSTSSLPSGVTGAGGGNMIRITGMATGLDVDSLVKKMLTAEQTKIDKAKQQQQIVQWKQSAYQDIISSIKDLQSSFFDVTNPGNYLLNQSNYSNFTATSDTSSVATATAGLGATAGTYNVNVTQVAKVASISGDTFNTQDKLNTVQGWSGKGFTLSDGSNTATISIDASFSGNIDNLVSTINSQISSTAFNNKLSITNDGGKLKFISSDTNPISLDGTSVVDLGNSVQSIPASGVYETGTIQNQNFSGWSGNSITFSVDGGANTSLSLSGFTGTTSMDLVSFINNQINSNSNLTGKLKVSVVNDGTGDYIKFTPTSTSTVKVVSTTVSDLSELAGQNLKSASLYSSLTSLDSTLNSKLTLNLNYNGKDVSVTLDNSATGKNGTATINDLAQAISTATSGNVTLKFDDMTGKINLQTNAMGSVSTLQIENTSTVSGSSNTTAALLSAMGLSSTFVGNVSQSAQGIDAKLSITPQGTTTTTTLSENSNNFTVNGIMYSLNGTGGTSIAVTGNSQIIHDKIKGFLDKYNDIIDKIQTKLSEKKDSNYPPLTDVQKSGMTQTQIDQWNVKAQQGILRNDNNLKNLLTNLRSAFTAPVVDSNGKSTTSVFFGSNGSSTLGIDTSNDYTQGSKIKIVDDNQLNDMISQCGDQVMKLFTTTSLETDVTKNFNQSGIFSRIDTILKNNVGIIGSTYNSAILTKYANVQDDYSITGGAGENTLPDQTYTIQQQILRLNTEYNNKETDYYNQYSKLETAISTLSAQQSQLSALGA